MLSNEQIGKVLAIDAPLVLVVNAKDSTAVLNENKPYLLSTDILSIFSGAILIGFATLINYGTFRLFIDYSTPERLELENGEKKYLVAGGSDYHGTFAISYLQLVSKMPNVYAVPVGSSDLLFR